MSAATAAIEPSTTVSSPLPQNALAVSELEDLLYDILASGADPSLAPKALEAVQLFVHEHARTRKTHAEFVAFFESQSLSMQPERTMLMTLPPIETRGRAAETPALVALPSTPEPTFVTTAAGRNKNVVLWAVLVAAVSGIATLAFFAAIDVRDEFTELRADVTRSADDLKRAQAETEALRAELRKSSDRLQQVEQKGERLQRSFASPLDPSAD